MKILLAVFALVCILVVFTFPNTFDEIAHHIPHGYVMVKSGDLKIDPSHPPLSRYIIGLPLLFRNIDLPTWRGVEQAEFKNEFWRRNPHNLLYLSRMMIVLVSVLCGIILFLWAKSLYGVNAAFLSLILFTLCPNIIAHSCLATTDMVATTFILLAVATFWLYLERPSWKTIVIAGVALGLAQMSKYTALLLYPIFFLWSIKKPKVFWIFLISSIVLWAGYGFEFCPLLHNAIRAEEKLEVLSKYINPELLNIPIPFSTHIVGILGVINHGVKGHDMNFLGHVYRHGHPLKYIVTVLIKTPIPTLILLFTGFWIAFKRPSKKEWYIFSIISIFFVTASLGPLQLGIRYILPIYPLLFIIAGRAVKIKTWLLCILFTCAIFVITESCPNYLGYFNELVGGSSQGHKYLGDSDVDWGNNKSFKYGR